MSKRPPRSWIKQRQILGSPKYTAWRPLLPQGGPVSAGNSGLERQQGSRAPASWVVPQGEAARAGSGLWLAGPRPPSSLSPELVALGETRTEKRGWPQGSAGTSNPGPPLGGAALRRGFLPAAPRVPGWQAEGTVAMSWPSAKEAILLVVTAAQRPGRVRIKRGPQARLHQRACLARAWGGAQGAPCSVLVSHQHWGCPAAQGTGGTGEEKTSSMGPTKHQAASVPGPGLGGHWPPLVTSAMIQRAQGLGLSKLGPAPLLRGLRGPQGVHQQLSLPCFFF